MPTYRLKTHDIEAMQFDGTIESAQAICDWVNTVVQASITETDFFDAKIIPFQMMTQKFEGKDLLVLTGNKGMSLIIYNAKTLNFELVGTGNYLVEHEFPIAGVHIRYSKQMVTDYNLPDDEPINDGQKLRVPYITTGSDGIDIVLSSTGPDGKIFRFNFFKADFDSIERASSRKKKFLREFRKHYSVNND